MVQPLIPRVVGDGSAVSLGARYELLHSATAAGGNVYPCVIAVIHMN